MRGRIKGNNLCPKCNNHFRRDKRSYCIECERVFNKTNKPLYSRLKSQAKLKGVPFNLSFEHFIDLIYQECTCCDRYSFNKNKVGIDRLIPAHGYVLANCVSCCDSCNYMKRHHSVGRFLENCRAVVEEQK